MKPNVSPFDENREKESQEEMETMAAIAAVNPLDRISQDFNILQSTDFNRQVAPDTL